METNKKRSLIVAIAEGSRIIGDGAGLLWKLKDDMKFFKGLSTGNVNIAGRITSETFPNGTLPNRTMIAVTRDAEWTPKSDTVIKVLSPWEALDKAERSPGEKICWLGGGKLYDWGLKNITFDEIHITTVLGDFKGSVTFPLLPFSLEANYRLVNTVHIAKEDGRNSHDAIIRSYERNTQLFR